MNELYKRYPQEIQHILSKYPADRKQAAVMPLLFLAQQEHGYLQDQALQEIGDILGIETTEVSTLVGFYTLYHDKPGGKYRLQVCTDISCALRGADEFLENLCQALGIQPGETTPDGLVTIEEVKCLAACDKAPMYQVQTGEGISYHENQTIESTLALIEEWKAQNDHSEGEIHG